MKQQHYKETTIKLHVNRIKTFLKTINADAGTYLDKKDDNGYKRDFKKDVTDFWRDYVSVSVQEGRRYSRSLQLFFDENEIEFMTDGRDARRFWESIERIPCLQVGRAQDDIPTRKELKEILNVSKPRYTAVWFILLSSGIRTGELAKLPLNCVGMGESEREIRIPEDVTKADQPSRVTFMSTEALGKWKAYMRARDSYLERAEKLYPVSSKTEKYRRDQRRLAFPYAGNFRDAWNTMLRESGHGQKVEQVVSRGNKDITRYVFHTNVLRKFFISSMKNSGMNLSLLHAMCGHFPGSKKHGYLAKHYDRFKRNEMLREYNKHMHSVLIYERPPSPDNEVLELKERLEKQEEQLAVLSMNLSHALKNKG